jgi:hypothetical protein
MRLNDVLARRACFDLQYLSRLVKAHRLKTVSTIIRILAVMAGVSMNSLEIGFEYRRRS